MSRRYCATLILLALAALGAPGCKRKDAGPAVAPTPAPTPVPVDYAGLGVNELGRIPVVMYHDIGAKVGKNNKMNRTLSSFRQDLEYLYAKGFRPVNLRDVVNNKIDVPAGMSPVVLTFDDARESQFRLKEAGTALDVDPDCGLGVLEAFAREHPDWKPRATFFVLPKSRTTMESFGQIGMGADKLKYLIEKGYEIGNHTTQHKSLSSMSPERIQEELGGAQKVLQGQVPEIAIESFAAPFGVYPHNRKLWALLEKGTFQGTAYHHTGLCLAAWRPTLPPGAKAYNHQRIERITPEDIRFGVRYWADELTAGRMARYVSDGDPETVSFPQAELATANTTLLKSQGKRVNAYGLGGPGGSRRIRGVGEGPAATPTPEAGGK